MKGGGKKRETKRKKIEYLHWNPRSLVNWNLFENIWYVHSCDSLLSYHRKWPLSINLLNNITPHYSVGTLNSVKALKAAFKNYIEPLLQKRMTFLEKWPLLLMILKENDLKKEF